MLTQQKTRCGAEGCPQWYNRASDSLSPLDVSGVFCSYCQYWYCGPCSLSITSLSLSEICGPSRLFWYR